MIRVENIWKSFGDLRVLKGINLQVDQGEIISIVGASGAGKSTLLHIIGTLDRADQGQIFFDQVAVHQLNEKKLSQFRNRQIGFVFQFHHLLPEFTAVENVAIPAIISGKSRSESEKLAKGLLHTLSLSERAHHKPSALSGGEQQRVAVARALINRPQVVLADEPSGNLDSGSAGDLHQLFFRLRDELGQTFIIVTHNQDLAGMADRRLSIKDGLIESS